MVAHLAFSPNTNGRDFVAGNLCGRFNTLKQVLERFKFEAPWDRLFLIGSLPKEPESRKILIEDWLAHDLHGTGQLRPDSPLAITIETGRDVQVGLVRGSVPQNQAWSEFIKKLEAGDAQTVRTASKGREFRALVPGIKQLYSPPAFRRRALLCKIAGEAFSSGNVPKSLVTSQAGIEDVSLERQAYAELYPSPQIK